VTEELLGRVVRDDGVVPGRVVIEDGLIAAVTPDAAAATAPYLVPGFIDLHVHGWGGHDAMGGRDALDGMARALAARGVTSFLPTAVSAPLDVLHRFAQDVRAWMGGPSPEGAQPLGFNLEGPFLSQDRRGAHDQRHLRRPSDVARGELDGLVDGLRLTTIAPELDGAPELIAWFVERGVVVSLGHSASTLAQAQAGYAAGARSTTHLFNAMSGMEHRHPGLAAAALADDAVAVELIADDIHVDPVFYRIVARAKPATGLFVVSDALSLAGTDDGNARLGDLKVEVRAGRATLAGSDVIAGSVIALDTAVRHLVDAGIGLTDAVAAASRNPAHLLGADDRGRIEVGLRADLVELDSELDVTGTWIGGRRVGATAP
jgi:N-acetylglucosamine-6-phosphate deacetylase